MAIAFDAVYGTQGTAPTLTWAHTVSGSQRFLAVTVLTNNSAFATGVTYNSAALTGGPQQVADGTVRIQLWYLVAPDTGTHNVVVTGTGTNVIYTTSVSYTGVAQSGQPDASKSQGITASPDTTTLTTIADNCWTILGARTNGVVSASTGSTFRDDSASHLDFCYFDSNGAITPAGSHSMTVTNPGFNIYTVMMSISPDTSPTLTGPFFTHLNT